MSRLAIKGFVIRTIATGESSKIMTIFSSQVGKIKCMARGGRKFSKKSAGPPGLFCQIECEIYARENSELGTLSGYEIINNYAALTTDPIRFGYASAVCEIIDKGTQVNQSIPDLFELLSAFFDTASKSPGHSVKALFLGFFIKFLGILGYSPELNRCSVCGKENKGRSAHYLPRVGGIVCTADLPRGEKAARLSAKAIAVLRAMADSQLNRIAALEYEESIYDECKRFLFAFADYHMGLRPNLKSLKFLAQL